MPFTHTDAVAAKTHGAWQLGGERPRMSRAERCTKGSALQEVSKGVAGARARLTRSLFGDGTLCRFFLRALPEKLTSAPVRF